MRELKSRIEKLENEYRFQYWLDFERFAESCTEEQLESFITRGYIEPWPKPLPPGASRFDGLDRKTLERMWQESKRETLQSDLRSKADVEFFCSHGHWPEQKCEEVECTVTRSASRQYPKEEIHGYNSHDRGNA